MPTNEVRLALVAGLRQGDAVIRQLGHQVGSIDVPALVLLRALEGVDGAVSVHAVREAAFDALERGADFVTPDSEAALHG